MAVGSFDYGAGGQSAPQTTVVDVADREALVAAEFKVTFLKMNNKFQRRYTIMAMVEFTWTMSYPNEL